MLEYSSVADLFAGTEDLVSLDKVFHRLHSLQHDHLTDLTRAGEVTKMASHEFSEIAAQLPLERQERYARVYADIVYQGVMLLAAMAERERTQRVSQAT